MAATFLNLNRNKRSVVLDLKLDPDRERLLALAATADVLLHNLRPSAMKRLRLSYDELAAVNPRIIYCSVYGFGQDGPYAAQPAYDDTIQAVCGLAYLQGEMAGEPQYMATIPVDKTIPLYMMSGILAALYHRTQTGVGQHVEVPMFEAMVGYVMAENLWGAAFEPPMGKPLYPRVVSKVRKPYRTRDGYVGVVAYKDEQWLRLFEAAGRPDVARDPRFADIYARSLNVDALYGAVETVVAEMTTAQALEAFRAADVPVVEVKSTEQLLDDPHLREVGFFELFEHPSEGTIRHVASPWRFSQTPASVRRGAPRKGEHQAEVFAEVGAAPVGL
jgi:crotonobetainyl-CoA:carnitine CoA-transferase CaiB-like acyl-CoA transferase